MNNKGFTLLEIMIAILLLSVASLAVIAMQISSLKGYVSLRDNDEAVQIAQRTADYLAISSMQWRACPADGTPLAGCSPLYNGAPAYGSVATNSPFDDVNPLLAIDGSENWTSLSRDTPLRMNQRIRNSGSSLA